MQHENEHGIRVNKAGEPDVDYYEKKAYSMRDEAIAAGFRAVGNWMYRTLRNVWPSRKGQKGTRQHVVQSGWPWVDLILDSHPMRKTRRI